MAIKIISREILVCDICGSETFVTKCLGCGVAHCEQSRQKYGAPYMCRHVSDRVGIIYFCHECDTHTPPPADRIHRGFQTISLLREEAKEWHGNFEKRKKNAEQESEIELKKKFLRV